MFEEEYKELWLATDLIAERIRALGDYAPATYSQFAALSAIPEAEGVPAAEAMIRELLERHETVARTAREVLAMAESAADQVTVDLLTQRLQIHEKTAWMRRSLTEYEPRPRHGLPLQVIPPPQPLANRRPSPRPRSAPPR